MIFFFTRNNDNQSNNDKKSRVLGVRDIERRSRITIDTYKEPPPCRGCPGENGGGVTLNVNLTTQKYINNKLFFNIFNFRKKKRKD